MYEIHCVQIYGYTSYWQFSVHSHEVHGEDSSSREWTVEHRYLVENTLHMVALEGERLFVGIESFLQLHRPS